MRSRASILSKTCPYCGARSKAEAKIPVPSNMPTLEFNLDDLDALVEKQSIGQLLALVELLPYKTFVCVKCASEFRLASRSAKELVGAMLRNLQPILPQTQPAKTRAKAPVRTTPKPPPAQPLPVAPQAAPVAAPEWEAESLDSLFDYSVDKKSAG